MIVAVIVDAAGPVIVAVHVHVHPTVFVIEGSERSVRLADFYDHAYGSVPVHVHGYDHGCGHGHDHGLWSFDGPL